MIGFVVCGAAVVGWVAFIWYLVYPALNSDYFQDVIAEQMRKSIWQDDWK